MSPADIFKQFLSANTLMQLATMSENGPWICSVYFVADEKNNLYWISARSRQHSKDIEGNSAVAATIVHDAVQKQAVQITGEASEIPPEETERVSALYAKRFGDSPSRLQEIQANTPDGRAYFVLKPHTIALWDEVHFPHNPKQAVTCLF